MALTLYTDPGNFRAFKALIAAEYNGIEVAIPDFKILQDNVTPEFKKKSPLGKVPVLETPSGSIFESNAISRYIARMRRDTELTGVSFFESGQVDQWIDFCSHDIELPATMWFYPVLGYMPYNAAATGKAKQDLSRALSVLDAHLLDKTYLVGHKISLADITIVSALVYPFKFVCDPSFRAPFPNVIRWFDTCVHLPQFENVIGKVILAEVELTPAGVAALPNPSVPTASAPAAKSKTDKPKTDKAPKEEKPKSDKAPKAEKAPKQEKPKAEKAEKPKAEKAPKPKDDEDDDEPLVPVEKKEEHIFKILDANQKSAFNMDEWKRTYSNCGEDYAGAMNYFWDKFDAEGWSLWRGDYLYNDENKILFMTANLVGGFMQRNDEIRKWLFGSCTVRGVEEAGKMKVTHIFLIRGQEIKPLLDCNPDAEYYNWNKYAVPVSEQDKKTIFDFWCTEGPLDGEPMLVSRCFK